MVLGFIINVGEPILLFQRLFCLKDAELNFRG